MLRLPEGCFKPLLVLWTHACSTVYHCLLLWHNLCTIKVILHWREGGKGEVKRRTEGRERGERGGRRGRWRWRRGRERGAKLLGSGESYVCWLQCYTSLMQSSISNLLQVQESPSGSQSPIHQLSITLTTAGERVLWRRKSSVLPGHISKFKNPIFPGPIIISEAWDTFI